MNFKIIAKQIYKGFLVNWKMFIMLILFCVATLSMIFGALAFAVQFKNEIYQPTISRNTFSIGNLKNEFSYSDNSNATFKTNKKFETYFLNQINKIGDGETKKSSLKFTNDDLKRIYQEDGYVNWVEFSDEQKEAGEKLVNYAADFLGNLRLKILDQYLKEKSNWTFNLWSNQAGVAKLLGNSQPMRLFTSNLHLSQSGNVIKYHQIIPDDSNFISIYISEKQLNTTNKMGDLITIKFDNLYQSKNLQAKVVGTFIDYLNIGNSNFNDNRFLIDTQDYFHFVQNQNIGYQMIDYRNGSDLSYPRFTLFTGENYSSTDYTSQFNQANQQINELFFDHFQGFSLSDEFKTNYVIMTQKYEMILLIMLGISFLIIILFYIVLYFLIVQTIKSDLKISFFLNNLGMSYREISWIQVLRLTIPLCFSIILSFVISSGIKSLFWSAFSPYYNIHFSFFYFHWENLLILFVGVFFIFGILFLINYLINWKLGKNKNSYVRVTIADRIAAHTKSWLKIKNQHLVISLSYGAKNFFQVFFITLITFMVFLIAGLSLNFTKNIQNISQIAAQHYLPIQSISASQGKVISEEKTSTYSFVENKEFTPIADELDLTHDSLKTIILELNKLNHDDLENFYLSHHFTKQLDQNFANKFKQIEYQTLPEDLKEQISEENFQELQTVVNNCALLNVQLAHNFGWKEGFNINFGQWTKMNFSSFDQTFFSLENILYKAMTNEYLSSGAKAFAVNSNETYYQTNFSHLNDDFSQGTLTKLPSEKVVNAYFPFSYKEEKNLKLNVYLNNQIINEIYLRNVGVNRFDNWDEIFILNKKQVFETFASTLEDETIKEIFANILASENLEQLDNGVYSTAKIPFFYQNILLRDDGQGKKITNYLNSLEAINIYGLNFEQIQNIVKQKLSQYNQLITSIQILLIILMVTISFIIIFLVIRENKNYFQNFKALGYKTWEISSFLLPWYFIGTILSTLVSFLIIFFTNNLIEATLSESLKMDLNYQLYPIVYFALIIIPMIFLLLFSLIVYLFIRWIKITNIVD